MMTTLEYVTKLAEEAEGYAEKAWGDGPGKMADSVRFESFTEVASVLRKVAKQIETGHESPLLRVGFGCCG